MFKTTMIGKAYCLRLRFAPPLLYTSAFGFQELS